MEDPDSLPPVDDLGQVSSPKVDRPAAVYARQSRTRGLRFSSCQNQIDLCQRVALQKGWTVTQVFSDEVQSSETLDRPELRRLISAIEGEQVDRLIIYSIDRLSRRLFHFQELLELFEKHNVELTVVTDPSYSDSAVSRLMTNIVAAANEFQQDLTRERMADMRAAMKRHGKRVAGRVPFGYQADPMTKKLIPDPKESTVVRDFFELASKGARPSDLASLANLNNWKDQNGETGNWTARRILKLLKNPTYVGAIRNEDSTLPGEHQAIVDVAVFDTVQRELIARRTRQAIRGERKDSPERPRANLLGTLVCGRCDRPMSTSVSHRGFSRYVYYRCRSESGGRPPCPGVNIGIYELERFVGSVLSDVADAQSEIPSELREHWNKLDERERQTGLSTAVHRVVYDHRSGEITIELKEDLAEAIAWGRKPS